MAVQMTRAEYEAKYGAPAPAPVKMTRAEYQAKYGSPPPSSEAPAPAPAAPSPIGTAADLLKGALGTAAKVIAPGIAPGAAYGLSKVKDAPGQMADAFKGGVQQFKQGFGEAASGKFPIEPALKMGAGAVSTASAPLAPAFAPVAKGVDFVADKVSNVPAVQKFALGKGGAVASRVAEDVGNANVIAGAVTGVKTPPAKAVTGAPGAIASKIKATVDVKGAISRDVDTLFKSTRGVESKVKLAEQKNVPIREIVSDPVVYKGIKVQKGTINPDEAVTTLDNRIDMMMNAKRDILPEIDRFTMKTPRETVRAKAIENARGKLSPADEADVIAAINKQVDALPEQMTLEELDNFRARFRQSSRNAKGLQKRDSEYAALENATRDTVFAATDNLPFDTNNQFGKLNTEIKNMIEARLFLDTTLRGQKVKGGRLGVYVARGIGAVVGVKGGALGALAGSEIGGMIANIVMNNQLGSSLKMRLIRNMTDDPVILKEAEALLQNAKSVDPLARPALPQGAIKLGPQQGESSVRSVQAPKGEPGRTPKGNQGGGKFFKTYLSSTEKP